MLVGEKIKTIRTLRKMTQEQLSERSGISLPAIQKYENSDRNPKYDQLVKISDALQISVNVFTDIKIKTISDLLSLLIALHQQVDMNFEAERDLNGNLYPDTIKISFRNPKINQVLSTYINAYQAQSDPATFEMVCQKLLDDTTEIQKNRDEQKELAKDSTRTFPQKFNDILLECSPAKQDLIVRLAQDVLESDL